MTLISIIVIAAGIFKVAGFEEAMISFTTLGLPIWFGTFIGLAEIAGGIGIWHRKTSTLAAMGLSLIMLGAVYYHAVHTPILEGIPALLLLGICIWIIRRKGTGVIG